MKIFDLTKEELKYLADIRPDWMLQKHPNFMASYKPEYMVNNDQIYMLENYPDYMEANHPKIWNDFKHYSKDIDDSIVSIIEIFREKRGKAK